MSLAAPGGRRAVRAAVTGALWPIPAAAVLVAMALGAALPELDLALQAGLEEPLAYVFSGGPSAARTLLSTVATALMSITTLLFSLTIVTLQLASSQYSPRLLQTFVRDRVVQVCLAVLLATFVYSLVVLRTVRSEDEADGGTFVPRLSVTVAFALTLVSVGALVTFLSHQTRQLRVETMMRDVHAEAGRTLRGSARLAADEEQPDEELPSVPVRARPVLARRSGFYARVAEASLVAALAEAGTVLLVARRPGETVIAGTPLGHAWTLDPTVPVPADDIASLVEEHLTVGHERVDDGDPSYGLRKLADIAARALSPGINDPTTAVHALSHMSDLLGLACGRDVWHRRLSDESDVERLFLRSWDFAALMDLAVTQVAHFGRDDATVIDRLFALLAEVAWQVRTDRQRDAVRHQCELLAHRARSEPPAGRTSEDVDRWAAAVQAALAGRWTRD